MSTSQSSGKAFVRTLRASRESSAITIGKGMAGATNNGTNLCRVNGGLKSFFSERRDCVGRLQPHLRQFVVRIHPGGGRRKARPANRLLVKPALLGASRESEAGFC